jgi:pimeloyl-ACP methyl ester carboxylesterase
MSKSNQRIGCNNLSKNAPTKSIDVGGSKFVYRDLGTDTGVPVIFLNHLAAELDRWDPRVVDGIAARRRVIVFDNRGIRASEGSTPNTVAAMAQDAVAFIRALGFGQVDLLGFSLGGMVAQQVALDRPSLVRRMLLVGTAPEGGDDIMHLEKPELRKILEDPTLTGYQVLVKLFFTPSESSQAAGQAFAARLAARTEDREPISGPNVAQVQLAAFRAWERVDGERFADLRRITQPCLVVNGVLDVMIPVRNSYFLSEHLPNATLLTYPDAGHGSLFQFPDSFVRQATLFLDS